MNGECSADHDCLSWLTADRLTPGRSTGLPECDSVPLTTRLADKPSQLSTSSSAASPPLSTPVPSSFLALMRIFYIAVAALGAIAAARQPSRSSSASQRQFGIHPLKDFTAPAKRVGQDACISYDGDWYCRMQSGVSFASNRIDATGLRPNGPLGLDLQNQRIAGRDIQAQSQCGLAAAENYNLGLAIGAVFIILGSSLLGVLIPGLSGHLSSRLGRRGSSSSFLRRAIPWTIFVLQHFGSGVILSTAFVHLLLEAALTFNNACISDLQYEATSPAIAMGAIWLMFATDCAYHSDDGNEDFRLTRILNTAGIIPAGCCGDKDGFEQQTISHDVKSGNQVASQADAESLNNAHRAQGRLAKYEVVSLEAGIIFHSVIIGVSVGSSGGSGWNAFLIAISFHQFCAGVALASRIALLPTTSLLAKVMMYAAFVLTTPIGVAIGIGVRRTFNGNDRNTLLAIGTLNSISAGILIYASLVQIVAGDFIYNRSMLKAPSSRSLIAFTVFTLGALIMSVLGKWA
ncbi:hypothetical protein V8E36_006955 [Tilletia maclaganii]